MSTIEEVRAAERKIQELVDALRTAGAGDPANMAAKLRDATDEYARAVRELKPGPSSSLSTIISTISGTSWQRSA